MDWPAAISCGVQKAPPPALSMILIANHSRFLFPSSDHPEEFIYLYGWNRISNSIRKRKYDFPKIVVDRPAKASLPRPPPLGIPIRIIHDADRFVMIPLIFL
jgi:hypothetical protein